ncbi:hypothetical protein [Chenggangzhangella methanolivorans]|uniref:Uncharacterized protein n=1 Tax=Chenggangzhangella methanolivorans TaxID=1437009 RepID=A0A9E6R9K8_9HYPH|nr:hypothetical protein [Chenggangzhangella methanolivorans]QZN99157.1 hypothetical protein K6K41_20305 [Chenggangzhangella methanolivorans]
MKFVWVVVFLFASTCAALADVGPPMAETLRRSADGGRISVRDARAIASGAEPYHRVFIHMKDDAPGGDGAGRQAGAQPSPPRRRACWRATLAERSRPRTTTVS